MKVTFDIPDWALQRDIYLFAGTEVVAMIPYSKGERWTKTGQCDYCGRCCENLPRIVQEPISREKNNNCIHLVKIGEKKECELGARRPWSCSVYDMHLGQCPDADELCAIRYEVKPL